MKEHLMHHLKKTLLLLVFAGVSAAHAGSYEDFFSAIRRDDPGALTTLLRRGFDANTPDPKGRQGLYAALQPEEPSLKAATVLVDWPKTDLNILNIKGESPLMLAALKGQLDLAAKMIKRGADVNKTGWAPLHYAASSDQPAIISLLLDNNAYIDAESPNGTTPLMMAAMYGPTAAVTLLLQEGADVSIRNQQGLTALQFAERGKRPDAIEAISKALRAKRPPGQW